MSEDGARSGALFNVEDLAADRHDRLMLGSRPPTARTLALYDEDFAVFGLARAVTQFAGHGAEDALASCRFLDARATLAA